jgi:hypothetical protein
MKFTCNASIVGFIVAGRNFYRSPYSRIQIWRNNHAQNYYQVHNISMNLDNGNPVCMASWTVQQLGIFLSWCILLGNIQFSVQPGDIIGLELPATTSDHGIYFTRGGPITYVFDGQLNSISTINLSNNRSYSEFQQLPQIIFNLTAGENCYTHTLNFNYYNVHVIYSIASANFQILVLLLLIFHRSLPNWISTSSRPRYSRKWTRRKENNHKAVPRYEIWMFWDYCGSNSRYIG